jgi:uncharacterized protein YozE (UPF0346 family)
VTFYQYLMRLGDNEADEVRELAYELELDRNFPRGSTNRDTIRAYVLKKHGSEMVKAFDGVWSRYVRSTAR